MLPQFGFSEFLLLAAAALIIVGPKDLPLMMRKLGQFVAKGRAAAREFQAAFDDIARQAELDELRKEIEDLKKANTLSEAEADMAAFERDVNADVMGRSGATGAQSRDAKAGSKDAAAAPKAGAGGSGPAEPAGTAGTAGPPAPGPAAKTAEATAAPRTGGAETKGSPA